jgi:CMP-N-acetylneuraminic acid synthetase
MQREMNPAAPKTVAALVPMRHHSERVPGKNYRLLAGKPLFSHILDALLQCPEINQVVVDTDSPIIMDSLREQYPSVVILERPEYLRADTMPMNEVLLHTTAQIQADLYLQTHSTNPLLRSETISRAIQTLVQQFPTYDSLFSVTRMQTRLWDQLCRPVNHNAAVLLRTQDLPPIYEENSCIYLFTRQTLEVRRNRLGERPYLFEIPAAEAWDIDEELDFQIVDLILSKSLIK